MTMGLKICGVSDPEILNYILNHPIPPKFIGFITNYKKSKRFVEYEKLKELLNVDKRDIKISDDNEFVDVLVAIEEEMTAIRELYVGGYISKGVYISETDRLYEKAKIFGI